MQAPKLQLRIVAGFLALFGLLLAGIFLGLYLAWLNETRHMTGAELQAVAQSLDALLAERRNEMGRIAKRVADDDRFVQAWNAADAPAGSILLERSRGDRRDVRVIASDASWNARMAVPPDAASLAHHMPMQSGSGEIARSWMERMPGEPNGVGVWIWSTVPLVGANKSGWISAGMPISEDIVAQFARVLRVDVAVLATGSDGGRVLAATSLVGTAAADLQQSWASDAPTGQPVHLDIGGREHMVLAVALPLSNDASGAQVLLAQPLDRVFAPYDYLPWVFLALSAAALLVFGIIITVTTSRLVRPLRILAQSVRRVTAGDYESPVHIRSTAEIADLGRAFDHMRVAIRKRDVEIRRLAFRDPLTGLPNRAQFRDDLRQAIAQAQREGTSCSILMLDLDRFKLVNDVLGHRFGDRVLNLVAERLKHGALGPYEKLARLGGDEFAVLLSGSEHSVALSVARRILRRFEQPITLEEHMVDLGASIGIATYPAHAPDADQLISRAEVAMYAAKRQQSGTVTYSPNLDSNSEESLSLLSELRLAIDRNELQLALQPKVQLTTGRVVGAEALLRWQHPVRGPVPPMHFIPFAEQTGFVRVLTAWVIERAVQTLETLREQGIELRLSVNLSARDLMDTQLAMKIGAILKRHTVDPGQLVLEITESAIMDDPQRALQTLMKLHEMGLRLSIDDFGTGYSSLAYLKQLPVDELKIDKSFVLNMERDLQDAKIVHSTVDLAPNLGLHVVAEGLESAKAWKLLSSLHCDEAQGFFIARPMPADQLADWMRNWNAPSWADEKLDSEFAAIAGD